MDIPTIKYAFTVYKAYYHIYFDNSNNKERWIITYSSEIIIRDDKVESHEYSFEASNKYDTTKTFKLVIDEEHIGEFTAWLYLHDIYHVGGHAPSIGSFDGKNYVLYPIIKLIDQ